MNPIENLLRKMQRRAKAKSPEIENKGELLDLVTVIVFEDDCTESI
jgi:hypothetical protein